MSLSVVTTLYKSKPFLEEFLEEIINSISVLEIDDFELIFVDDGSPDDSVNYLLERKKEINEIKIIELSRNFGHHYAMQTGLEYAKNELVFLIDNDLEVHPNFLIECYKNISKNPSIDVVYGYQEKRKGKLFENVSGSVFWWVLNKFSDVEIPNNLVTERLMNRNYLDNLLRLGDANLFLGGMMYWTGFNQFGIPVKKKLRKGKSTYSFRRRTNLMIQAITSFSGKPLEYLFYSGLLVTFGSLMSIIFLLIKKSIYGADVQLGWTSLVAINVLILGIVSTFLGLIGIYIFKIFRQVQNRPNAIIKRIL